MPTPPPRSASGPPRGGARRPWRRSRGLRRVPIWPRRPTGRRLRRTGPSPSSAPDAADRAVADEVERSILDTGLFRAASVHFETARAGLLPVSEQTLRAVGSVLVRHPGLQIEVGGHTDAVGSEADNERLSQARAESVVAFLVAAGVARERLAAVGYGERRPVASGATETGRALNRRVEFVVVDR